MTVRVRFFPRASSAPGHLEGFRVFLLETASAVSWTFNFFPAPDSHFRGFFVPRFTMLDPRSALLGKWTVLPPSGGPSTTRKNDNHTDSRCPLPPNPRPLFYRRFLASTLDDDWIFLPIFLGYLPLSARAACDGMVKWRIPPF